MLHPDLGKMVCGLEGEEGFRVYHDQSLIKEPFANGTSWHLDNPYWSFKSRHATSIWIALEVCNRRSTAACASFPMCSHKLAPNDNVPIGPDMGDLFKIYPKMAEIDGLASGAKESGKCSFHNGLTAHGSGANMTRGRRIAMTCGFLPEGSTFNGQRTLCHRLISNHLLWVMSWKTMGKIRWFIPRENWWPLKGFGLFSVVGVDLRATVRSRKADRRPEVDGYHRGFDNRIIQGACLTPHQLLLLRVVPSQATINDQRVPVM